MQRRCSKQAFWITRAAVAAGNVEIARPHAVDRMDQRGVEYADVELAMVRGVYDSCDFERGSWRYRLRIPAVTIAVVLRSEDSVVVMTVMT
jgi:hypothetical protein